MSLTTASAGDGHLTLQYGEVGFCQLSDYPPEGQMQGSSCSETVFVDVIICVVHIHLLYLLIAPSRT